MYVPSNSFILQAKPTTFCILLFSSAEHFTLDPASQAERRPQASAWQGAWQTPRDKHPQSANIPSIQGAISILFCHFSQIFDARPTSILFCHFCIYMMLGLFPYFFVTFHKYLMLGYFHTFLSFLHTNI